MVSVVPRTRPAYSPEFRREAIELLRQGRSPRELSESLGVSEQTLRNWARQDQIDRRERDDGVTTDERAELARLRRGMIDALDAQLAPLDRELRTYARRQPGCRALMRHYGIGPLTAVTILAELGDARRFSSSRHAVRYAGLDITVYQSDAHRAPGHLSRQGPPALRSALYEAVQTARRTGSPTTPTTSRPANVSAATARASPWRASCSSAATTRCATSARRPCSPPEDTSRAARHSHRCTAAGSPHTPAATPTRGRP
jgi:transposase